MFLRHLTKTFATFRLKLVYRKAIYIKNNSILLKKIMYYKYFGKHIFNHSTRNEIVRSIVSPTIYI